MRRLTLSVTRRCNSSCVCCYEGSNRPRGIESALSVGEISGLLEEAQALGCTELVIIGGEPTLRPDLAEVIAESVRRGLRVGVSTNGLQFSGSLARDLARYPLWFVSFSIFAFSSEVHDGMSRVPGALDRAKRGLVAAVEAGLPATVAIPVSSMNARFVEESIRQATQFGAQCVTLLYVTPTGSGRSLAGLSIPVSRWRPLVDRLAAAHDTAGHRWLLQTEPVVARCAKELTRWRSAGFSGECRTASRDTVFVSAEGYILPCSFCAQPQAVARWEPGALNSVVGQNWGARGFAGSPPNGRLDVCWALRRSCPTLHRAIRRLRVRGYIPICPFEIIPTEQLLSTCVSTNASAQ